MIYKIILYFSIFLISTFLSYIFALWMKKISFKLNILDYPNENRKVHDRPIPLLGGWAIYIVFVLMMIIFCLFFKSWIFSPSIDILQIVGILFAGFIVMLGGTLDDKYNFSAKKQLIFILLACVFIIFTGTNIKFITRPGGGVIDLTGPEMKFFGFNISLFGAIFTFLWLIIITNTTKLLDGLDGLAAGITEIGMFVLFIVSLFWDKPYTGTSIMILIFSGAIFGFLILNFFPAKIFLGNGGSNLLGLMLGALSIISGAKIATALLVMGLPLLDMTWVIIQRIIKKESPFTHADKKHLHFRLLEIGFSKKQSVLFMYFVSIVFGLVALFQNTIGKISTILALFVFTICIFFYIYKKRDEKKVLNNN
ncbi:MAG: MraY family glycosyltransferase [Patescibacteria group bacterium]|nr:MraY family glycosyltransferase [Patescibacteria group bacterium]MDD4304632.1 MraY family glycosyltransferase [Patescibacteria group bacterium]MDD4695559.1 MraY family glycosyltransferase [Patescibacteria group bacterium]